LRGHPAAILNLAYQAGKKAAARDTGLALDAFPETSPFSLEHALDEQFWPDVTNLAEGPARNTRGN
jgi:hypothetical protein